MGRKKYTLVEVKEYIVNFEYELLSTEYVGVLDKLILRCPNGHIYKANFNNFQNGKRCPKCAGRYKTQNEVKEYIESFDYELISGIYSNAHSKFELKCPDGHSFIMSWNDFQQKHRCPICKNNGWSKPEKEIAEYVKTIYFNEVIENDRTQIINHLTGKNLELDVWLPEVNKAIEFNGIWWHSSEYSKIKDCIKRDQCFERGIDLLVIEQQDWLDDKECQLFRIRKMLE